MIDGLQWYGNSTGNMDLKFPVKMSSCCQVMKYNIIMFWTCMIDSLQWYGNSTGKAYQIFPGEFHYAARSRNILCFGHDMIVCNGMEILQKMCT